MRRETTENQEWRALRVQPSGRPCGAPSGLDAGRSLCERQGQSKSTTNKQPFQTPDHNLTLTKSGPTYGVHLRAQPHHVYQPTPQNVFNRLRPSTRCDWSCGHSRAPSESSVRSEIFVATHAANSPTPSGWPIPLLTELEFISIADATKMSPRRGLLALWHFVR
jgi:hypothetical protein